MHDQDSRCFAVPCLERVITGKRVPCRACTCLQQPGSLGTRLTAFQERKPSLHPSAPPRCRQLHSFHPPCLAYHSNPAFTSLSLSLLFGACQDRTMSCTQQSRNVGHCNTSLCCSLLPVMHVFDHDQQHAASELFGRSALTACLNESLRRRGRTQRRQQQACHTVAGLGSRSLPEQLLSLGSPKLGSLATCSFHASTCNHGGVGRKSNWLLKTIQPCPLSLLLRA